MESASLLNKLKAVQHGNNVRKFMEGLLSSLRVTLTLAPLKRELRRKINGTVLCNQLI